MLSLSTHTEGNHSPVQPAVLVRLHVLSPDAQGCRHHDGHPKPAAADDECHEQAEVVHGRDLVSVK